MNYAKIKIWVQPVGDLWNLKYNNEVIYRMRSMEDAIEESKSHLLGILKKAEEGTLAEIVVETKEGLLKTIPFNPKDIEEPPKNHWRIVSPADH